MSINLSTSPSNNILSSPPIFQDWAPDPPLQTIYWNVVNPTILYPTLRTFNIKDVINNPDFAQYTQFKLNVVKTYGSNPPPAPFLANVEFKEEDGFTSAGFINDPGNFPANYYSQTKLLTQSNYKIKYSFTFQNINLLPVSQWPYEHRIIFTIFGKNANGTWSPAIGWSYLTQFFVTNQTVTVTPQTISFVHYQNTPLEHQDIVVSGNDWTVTGRAHFVITSSDSNVTITDHINNDGEHYQTASGSGTATITITLGDFYDIGVIDPAELNKQFPVTQGASTFVTNILINVQVYNHGTFNVTPRHLDFTAVRNIQEPVPQNVIATSSVMPFSITPDPWLIAYLDNAIMYGVLMQVLVVVPIPTANMQPGTYNGTIVLANVINGVPSQVTITVTYNLYGYVISPYTIGRKAFTLDPLFFQFVTTYINTYFQLTATVQVFEFFTANQTTFTINDKVPLFNGKAQLNYGKTIHRLMDRLKEPNTLEYQYKYALFTLNVQEIDSSNNSIIRQTTLNNLEFVAGLSRNIINDIGIIDFNSDESRVTRRSLYKCNVLLAENINYELEVKANNTFIYSDILNLANSQIHSKIIDFNPFNPGDIIDISLREIGTNNYHGFKRFRVFPLGKYSNLIYWENEFLLESIFEFTGTYSINSEFEFRSQNLYNNLVEYFKQIDNTKVVKLTINTGWILKSDIDTIESLMRSRKVWLLLNNTNIDIVPITKKMANQDSSKELYDYTVEFQINRNYNEETYTF